MIGFAALSLCHPSRRERTAPRDARCSSNSQVIGPSSEEPQTAPFVKEQQSRAALSLLVQLEQSHRGRRTVPHGPLKQQRVVAVVPAVRGVARGARASTTSTRDLELYGANGRLVHWFWPFLLEAAEAVAHAGRFVRDVL